MQRQWLTLETHGIVLLRNEEPAKIFLRQTRPTTPAIYIKSTYLLSNLKTLSENV